MTSQTQYWFGEFRLDAGERALYRHGELVAMTPKAFETLLFLVEHHGHIVDKQALMNAVWPETFVEEVSLARNVSVLRKTLQNGAPGQQFIQTIPKRGYRFVAPVRSEAREETMAIATPPQAQETEVHQLGWAPPGVTPAVERRPSAFPKSWWFALAAIVLTVALAAVGVLTLHSTEALPRVARIVQLTSLGRVADPLGLSGDRLFLGLRSGGSREIAQIPAQPAIVPTPDALRIPTGLLDPRIYDASPDGSELLLSSTVGPEEERPLWVMSAAGGTPRRLGDLRASDAAWSPDGKSIAYTSGTSVYAASAEGTEARRLADAPGTTSSPRWSPDGRVIRFTLEDATSGAASLWEIPSTGGTPRHLYPSLGQPSDRWGLGVAHGVWAPDGRFYYFMVQRFSEPNSSEIWAARQTRDAGDADPKQIFTSPLSLGRPILSADGKKMYLAAHQEDRELLKLDTTRRRFVSWLGGLAIGAADYSPDGEWITYVTFPEGTLWRARADGSKRIELTDPSAIPFTPAFSPDGESIAYADSRIPGASKIYVVPRDGGSATEVAPGNDGSPSWFPDGHSLLYRHYGGMEGDASDSPGLYRVDIRTMQRESLPASEGFADPAVSPDGRAILALSADLHHLMLYRLATRRWREIASGVFLRLPCWSRDGAFAYFQDYYQGSEQPIYRVRLADGRIEKVTTVADIQRTDVFNGYIFHGLAPNGAPIVSLIRNKSDVLALDLDLPR